MIEDRETELIKKCLSDGQIPRVLYKYRELNEWTYQILEKCELYFATPNSFNDPFDCKLNPTNIFEAELAAYLTAKQTICKGGINKEKLEELLHIENVNELIQQSIDRVMNRTGICCMTGRNDNILMWSHYADSHRGICLGFDVLEDPSFFVYPIKMDYVSEYPKISSIGPEFARLLLKSKYLGWKYEEEVRIYKSESGPYSYNPKALKEIIFGCKTDQSDIEKVKQIVGNNPLLQHVVFYKAELDSTGYRIII